MKKLFLVLVGLQFLLSVQLSASHFRFGHLSWQPTGKPGEVEFRLINAFRRDGYNGSAEDGFPKTGDIIYESIGGTSFDFGDGSFGTTTLRYLVTSYSVAENYIIGEALEPETDNRGLRYTYAGNGPYIAGIYSCCRIDNLNNRDSSNYNVQTTVYPNTGNRSPVSSLFPIITVPSGTVSFPVPAVDPDGDKLRWRISTVEEAVGSSGFSGDGDPPNLSINQNTGIITWNNTGLDQTDYWTVQVIIEDLTTNNTVKTKTPVDFLLRIGSDPLNNPPVCTITPSGPIHSYVNQPFSFIVTGSDPDTNDIVTLNTAGLPPGATMTPSLPYTGLPNQTVQSTFNWVTTFQQGGAYQLIFSAFDDSGYQTLAPVTITISPLLVVAGSPTVASEGCSPTNGYVDPGELVTVNFPIKNIAPLSTTNLVATLQAGDGITFPSAAQFYGAIPSNGVVSKPFTFRANGACFGTITARLALTEGTNSYGTLEYTIHLGPPARVLDENFDTIIPPVLPTSWAATNQGLTTVWKTTPASFDTSPNSAYAPDPSQRSTNDLYSPFFSVPTAGAELSFRHSYNTDPNDYGSLQISITNAPFTNITAVGGVFTTNGYPNTNGWSGNSGGFVTTRLTMPSSSLGQSVKLRWRFLSNVGVSGVGWYVDSIAVTGNQGCCFDPTTADVDVLQSVSANPLLAGQNLDYYLTVRNNGPATATAVSLVDTLPAGVSLVSVTNSHGSYSQVGGQVLFDIGTLTNGEIANIRLRVASSSEGTLSNLAVVNLTQYDYNYKNNTNAFVSDAAVGVIVQNASVVEGNSGNTFLSFNCSVSQVSSRTVSVDYTTVGVTATPFADFTSTSGTLTFTPGISSQTIFIPIRGEFTNEFDETFHLMLSNPTNAFLSTNRAVGTILNDDLQPNLVVTGFDVVSENCPALNSAVDDGETVTVNVTIKNAATGTATTTNIVATLQTSGGVTSLGTQKTYGALTTVGNSVTMPFTLMANGVCGGTATATFNIQDGSTTLSPISYTFSIGKKRVPLFQEFDSVTAPALPPNWSASHSGFTTNWRTTTLFFDSFPNAVYAVNPSSQSTNDLVSPAIPIVSTDARLTFRHAYDTDDYARLFIAVGTAPYTDIVSAGGSFVSADPTNGWTGYSPIFRETIIDLPDSAVGQNIRLKWRMESDTIIGAPGWYIDNVMVTDGYLCCVQPPRVTTQITSNSLAIFWPVAATNYYMEYTTNLTPPAAWFPLTNSVQVYGTNFGVSNNLVGPGKFFRLRQ